MNTKLRAQDQCNRILQALLGREELVNQWWVSPNRAFELRTPGAIWEGDNWRRVYNYLRGQLNGDYL